MCSRLLSVRLRSPRHVGAVDTELVGEHLLAEVLGFPIGPEIAADGSL
jgi:hypothetical protein